MTPETTKENVDDTLFVQVGSAEGQIRNTRGIVRNQNVKAVSQTNTNGDASGTLTKSGSDSKLTKVVNEGITTGHKKNVVIDMSQDSEEGVSEEEINAIKERRDVMKLQKGVKMKLTNVSVEDQRLMRAKGVENNGLEIYTEEQSRDVFAKKEDTAEEKTPRFDMAA